VSESTPLSPLDGVDLLLADLDGVVYRGAAAIAYAVESINAAASGCAVGYVTNNASRTPETVAEQLQGLGLHAKPRDVVTSPQAAVRLLAGLVDPGALVLAVGGEGLHSELKNAGFRVTTSADDAPQAVIQGFSPELGWADLAEASYALRPDPDLPWVATNTDWTIPTGRGIAPGNGTLVSAVHSAVGRLPVVAGKPEVAIFDEAVARFSGTNALFLGDRLDTDILGANRAGIASALVLTGIDQAKQLLAADAASRPTFILGDLRELHEPYPEVRESVESDGSRLVRVRSAAVRMRENVVSVEAEGDNEVDLTRAGTAAIWGSGLAIYGLDVAEALYA